MALDLDTLKSARTTAKRAVTVAAKGLRNAVSLGMDSVPSLVTDLECKFLNFLDTSEEFKDFVSENNVPPDKTVVNNLSIDEYEADVLATYIFSISVYRESKPATASVQPQSTPVHLKKRDVPKLSGERKDWPEFKHVWENLIVPSISNKVARNLNYLARSSRHIEKLKTLVQVLMMHTIRCGVL